MVGGPGQDGGKSVYVAVDDLDALYERVKASGVTIEQEPVQRDYGGREFICRDPEGNVWCFGGYWPMLVSTPCQELKSKKRMSGLLPDRP